ITPPLEKCEWAIPPVAPETTAASAPPVRCRPRTPGSATSPSFHTVRACAANPLHRERLLPLRPSGSPSPARTSSHLDLGRSSSSRAAADRSIAHSLPPQRSWPVTALEYEWTGLQR